METPQTAVPEAPLSCAPPADPSPSMTEGPYFKPGSPERASMLEPTTPGEKLVLTGHVLSTRCEPIPHTLLDFWQTDGNGAYDNQGYGMRGHQFSDDTGKYALMTVLPGLYPGRTPHIHVKVQPPGGATITTQLFFPNVQGNETDRIFDERLLVRLGEVSDGWAGTFDFVLSIP